MKGSVYLAGPITGLSWEDATKWRNEVKAALAPMGVVCFSPLRAKTYLSHLDKLDDHYSQSVSPLSTPRGIMTRDRWDATRCDVLFANFLGVTRVSIGTVMEIAWADNERIPIVIVMEPDNVHQHSMVKEAAGYIVPTLDEGIDIVGALFTED
jgi:nucleoside 2-deoxyribosyltransferase